MTVKTIIKQYDFNLKYVKVLVQELTQEQMTTMPLKGLVNHPAFTLGHLVSGSALMVEKSGAKFKLLDGWAEL